MVSRGWCSGTYAPIVSPASRYGIVAEIESCLVLLDRNTEYPRTPRERDSQFQTPPLKLLGFRAFNTLLSVLNLYKMGRGTVRTWLSETLLSH